MCTLYVVVLQVTRYLDVDGLFLDCTFSFRYGRKLSRVENIADNSEKWDNDSADVIIEGAITFFKVFLRICWYFRCCQKLKNTDNIFRGGNNFKLSVINSLLIPESIYFIGYHLKSWLCFMPTPFTHQWNSTAAERFRNNFIDIVQWI